MLLAVGIVKCLFFKDLDFLNEYLSKDYSNVDFFNDGPLKCIFFEHSKSVVLTDHFNVDLPNEYFFHELANIFSGAIISWIFREECLTKAPFNVDFLNQCHFCKGQI